MSLLAAAEAAVRAVEGSVHVSGIQDGTLQPATQSGPPSPAKPSATLFVRGLHPATTSAELEAVFSDLGPLKIAFVVKAGSAVSDGKDDSSTTPGSADNSTTPNRGIGFVTFALQQDAEKAFAMAIPKTGGGIKVRERLVRVEYAQPKPSRKERAGKAKEHVTLGESRKRKRKDEDGPRKEAKVVVLAPRRDPNAPNTVLLSGLPAGLTKKALYKKVRKLGDVREIIFPAEDDSTKAAVITSSPFHASQVSNKLDQHIFKGGRVTAMVKSKPRTSLPGGGAQRPPTETTKGSRLIVRNLPFRTTVESLQELFARFGKVLQVDLPTLPSTVTDHPSPFPKIRGFAFVWMASLDEAQKAIEGANAQVINPSNRQDGGRTIAVDFALSKKEYLEAEQQAQLEKPREAVMNDGGEENLPDIGDSDAEAEVGEEDDSAEDGSDTGTDSEGAGSMQGSEKDVAGVTSKAYSTESTLFIRNLLFETTEDSVYQLFRHFGPLRYAKITTDYATGRSRGTAFVCFHRREDAERCLDAAEKVRAGASDQEAVHVNGKNPFKMPSVLSVFTGDSGEEAELKAQFTLDGRLLNVSRAVSRDEADDLKMQGEKKKISKDKRNTYLMKEGVIFTNSDEAKGLPAIEVEKRMTSYNTRKRLIASNPSLYISKTRLSIRQLPLHVTNHHLKKLALFASKAFRAEVKEGKRPMLTPDEIEDAKTTIAMNFSSPGAVSQVKVIRSKDRVDTVSGLGKSKGYGFVEMRTHAEALMVLRWLNNNPEANTLTWQWFKEDLKKSLKTTGEKEDKERQRMLIERAKEAETETESGGQGMKSKQRLIVEFSIENIVTVKRLQARAQNRSTKVRVKDVVETEANGAGEDDGNGDDAPRAEKRGATKTSNADPKLGAILARRRREKRQKTG